VSRSGFVIFTAVKKFYSEGHNLFQPQILPVISRLNISMRTRVGPQGGATAFRRDEDQPEVNQAPRKWGWGWGGRGLKPQAYALTDMFTHLLKLKQGSIPPPLLPPPAP
jgi:hypothetical protein